MGEGFVIVFLVLSVLSLVCIVSSIVFLRKGKPGFSIAAAVVGAASGAEAISFLIMQVFIAVMLFVGYVVYIIYLNCKKNARAAADNSKNDRTDG